MTATGSPIKIPVIAKRISADTFTTIAKLWNLPASFVLNELNTNNTTIKIIVTIHSVKLNGNAQSGTNDTATPNRVPVSVHPNRIEIYIAATQDTTATRAG